MKVAKICGVRVLDFLPAKQTFDKEILNLGLHDQISSCGGSKIILSILNVIKKGVTILGLSSGAVSVSDT